MDWYYAQDGDRQGPITGVDLKKLADDGTLKPEDLVWREGLTDWIEARKVRGLFTVAKPELPPEAANANEATEAATTAKKDEDGLQIQPGATSDDGDDDGGDEDGLSLGEIKIDTRRRRKKKKVAAKKTPDKIAPPKKEPEQRDEKEPVTKGVAKKSAVLAALPEKIEPPKGADEKTADDGAGAAGELPVEVDTKKRKRKPKKERVPGSGSSARRHPIDVILSGTRLLLGESIVDRMTTLLVAAGSWGIFVAMGAVVLFAIVLGIKAGTILVTLPVGLGFAVSLLVYQYIAVRCCRALDQSVRSMPVRISSCVFLLDIASISFLALGCVAFLFLGGTAIVAGQYYMVLYAIGALLLGFFAGLICLFPKSVRVEPVDELTPGEEAIGLYTFAVKLWCRLGQALFGVGVMLAIAGFLWACVTIAIGGTGASPARDQTASSSTVSVEDGMASYFGAVNEALEMNGLEGVDTSQIDQLQSQLGGLGGSPSASAKPRPAGPMAKGVALAATSAMMLSWCATAPLWIYLGTLIAMLFLDLMRAVLQLNRLDVYDVEPPKPPMLGGGATDNDGTPTDDGKEPGGEGEGKPSKTESYTDRE